MTDADTIKALITMLMAMIGVFYASFIYEMRQLRSNINKVRNTITHHEFRIITLERKMGIPEYTYKEESSS